MPAPAPSRAYTVARWVVAFLVCVYGFGKLTGAQFTVLESELDKPLGDVSGFWLTWYYFGYSPAYGSLIALTQIAGGLLLTVRRTVLPAALVLFGLMSNVVLVDVFYGVDLGGTLSAVVVWGLLLVVLAHHRAELVRVFWLDQRAPGAPSRAARAGAAAGRVLLVVVPAALTYWVANHNNRAPTPIDGTWDVVDAGRAPPASVPSVIYFERNRAHMVVFRYAERSTTHHFEVDSAGRALRIWARWLAKGAPVFTGAYAHDGDRLALQGAWAALGPVRLELRRRAGRPTSAR